MSDPQPLPPEVLVELEPCPFCGGELTITKHFRDPIWQGVHRCKVAGPIMFEWTDDPKRIATAWNTRSTARSTEAMRAELAAARELFTMHTAEVHAWLAGLAQTFGLPGGNVRETCAAIMDAAEQLRAEYQREVAASGGHLSDALSAAMRAENERLKAGDDRLISDVMLQQEEALIALEAKLKAAREALEKARKHLVYIEEGCAGGGLSAHMAGRTAEAGIDLIDACLSTITPTGDKE